MTGEEFPVLPYRDAVAGSTSGWSGSDTSAARARRDDADGTTSQRQRLALGLVRRWGVYGQTWIEVAYALDLHHGQASGVLSNLHAAGHLCRLKDQRDGCAIYVVPEWVKGRRTVAYRRQGAALESRLASLVAEVERCRRAGQSFIEVDTVARLLSLPTAPGE